MIVPYVNFQLEISHSYTLPIISWIHNTSLYILYIFFHNSRYQKNFIQFSIKWNKVDEETGLII